MTSKDIPATLPVSAHTPKTSRPRRPRFPFFVKLLMLTGVLIVIVTGLSVGLTVSRAQEVATTEVNRSIRDAADLFAEFQQNRLRQLELGATTIGSDVGFVSYIQDALYRPPISETESDEMASEAATMEGGGSSIDYASILDQLQQRQRLLSSDLLVVTDDQGYLVARTDEARLTGAGAEPVDLYEQQTLLRRVVDGEAKIASGVISLNGRLYHAAIGPLSIGAGGVVVGYIVNAFAIDDRFANRIASTTRAGVLFLGGTGEGASPVAVRSTDAPRADEVMRLSEMSTLTKGAHLDVRNVEIAGGEYVMTGQALLSGSEPVGSAIFVRSRDDELAPFREIERTLVVTGGLALLLAFLLSWLIARRLTRPVEELAQIAQAVTEGDYSVRPDTRGQDEVGILSRSFAQMISALRDKAELEELYQDLTAKGDSGRIAAVEPKLETGTVLVTDLRALPGVTVESGARGLIRGVESLLALQTKEIERQDGSVVGVVGHQVVSLFSGQRGAIHAIRAARAIVEEVSLQETMDADQIRVAAGIASGDLVKGSVAAGDMSALAITGAAATAALMYAWSAPQDHAYVAADSAQRVGSEILAASSQAVVHGSSDAETISVVSVPLRALTTSMMKAPSGVATSSLEATLRLEATAPTSELKAGQLFAGRYLIDKMLGRGGMGVVYRANDQQLDEPVAIKVLPSEIMRKSPEELERFKREIRLARRITHRNVLRTYDYGEAEGVYFISMEFIRGYTLSELLDQSSGITPRNALTIMRQICRGLQAAHEEGIIHRDIKPQNVLIDHRGEAKLMDFGIARMTESNEAMTAAGIVIGTPHYMSPEQVQGRTIDPRSDVYSMGIMLYQLMCGRLPFSSDSLAAILTAHITQAPVEPITLRPDIGREVNAIILRCLEKEPSRRFENAGDLLMELDRLQLSSAA